MGNSLGGRKSTKVMKINGETFKLKTPVKAEEVVKDYPGHVLLESESVKHFGIRAKALEGYQNLEPKRLYFLVELPEAPKERVPRRARSNINMSAKDRLESLMLSRRSVSDLTLMKPKSCVIPEEPEEGGEGEGTMRVKMRLPKADIERLMKESKNETEAAEKIMQLCMASSSSNSPREGVNNGNNGMGLQQQQQLRWEGSLGRRRVVAEGGLKTRDRERKVSFQPISEGGSQIEVSS